jgi:hypothetical protein
MCIRRTALVFGVLLLIAISTYAKDSETPTVRLRQNIRKQSEDWYDYILICASLRSLFKRETRNFVNAWQSLPLLQPNSTVLKGKAAGRSCICSGDDSRVLLDGHGVKLYKVSSDTEATINMFTKHVPLLAFQLHGEKGCVSMFY